MSASSKVLVNASVSLAPVPGPTSHYAQNWLKTLLNDPQVTDICLNGSTHVFADRGLGLEPIQDCPWSDDELKSWVLEQLSWVGKTWDAKHPFVDASLRSGHRLHAAFPPIAPHGILISLRRLPCAGVHAEGSNPAAEAARRWGNSPLYFKLLEVVGSGDSVILSGATGSGKTTLANDLLSQVPAHERIIALEDTAELAPAHPHFLSLLSRPANADGFGEVNLRTLLKQTLRMRPDRVVLGECRGAEVLELLQALNTGHKGALATLHANSPRDALRRLELLCMLACPGSIPHSVIRELLALGIQWIAQVKREGATRSIHELWKIEGREGDTILMRPFVSP
ncbi:MAG: CpaF family protein [Methylotenera sp.]|nr:CpaF family protein [Oligoflexia bacterium]